jgi:hypothetical protein
MRLFAKAAANVYLRRMFKAFEFCLPTMGAKVALGPEWLHEIKYDGFRLRVERDSDVSGWSPAADRTGQKNIPGSLRQR